MLTCAIIYLFFYFFFDYGLSGIDGTYIKAARNAFDSYKNAYVYKNYCGIYYRWADYGSLFFIRLIKANGPFTEAGQYQIFLNAALIYYLYLYDGKRKKLKLGIIMAAIVSTMSTAGLIVMLAILGMTMITKEKELVILELISACIVGAFSFSILFDKLNGFGVDSRMRNLRLAIKTIRTGHLWGCGFNNFKLSFYGLLNYFIFFGILAFAVVIVIAKGFKVIIRRHLQLGYATMAWLICSLMNEPIGYTYFMCCMIGVLLYQMYMYGNNKRLRWSRINESVVY
jgi:hypothetical protein